MAPYVRFGGLSLLVLGLFVHRAVDQPRRQALAVDALLLMLLGRVLLTLGQQVSATSYVTGFEWLIAAGDLGLGLGLLAWRTRSTEMPEAAPLLSANAGLLLKQTGGWIAGQGPRPKAGLGGFDAQPSTPPPMPSAPTALWPDGSAPLMPPGRGQAAVAAAVPPPPPAAAPSGPAPAETPPPPPVTAATAIPELPPIEPEGPRAQPLIPPAPPRQAKPAPLPPPSPGAPPRSEAIPRLD
jgi:hypothetical protein